MGLSRCRHDTIFNCDGQQSTCAYVILTGRLEAAAAHLKVGGQVSVAIGSAQELRHLSTKQVVHDASARLEVVQPWQQRSHRLPAQMTTRNQGQHSLYSKLCLPSTPTMSQCSKHTARMFKHSLPGNAAAPSVPGHVLRNTVAQLSCFCICCIQNTCVVCSNHHIKGN